MEISGLVITVALILSPVAWAVLLNLRDRRQSALYGTIMKQFVSEDFCGRVAIQIRCALLSRKGVATIDVLYCSQDEIWDVITRLSRIPTLSPNVSLEMKGAVDRQCLATFIVATTRRQPLRRTSRPSLATG